MDTVFEDLDPAAMANCQETVDLLVRALGDAAGPYCAVYPDPDIDSHFEPYDIAVVYAGADNDDGPLAEAALARLTHVPLGMFDFELTTSSMTDVPILLVARK